MWALETIVTRPGVNQLYSPPRTNKSTSIGVGLALSRIKQVCWMLSLHLSLILIIIIITILRDFADAGGGLRLWDGQVRCGERR